MLTERTRPHVSPAAIRARALAELAQELRLRDLVAQVRTPDESGRPALLLVTDPDHPGEGCRVVCDLGYGAVEWFWWCPDDGCPDPITPADELDVAVETVVAAFASRQA